MKNLEVDNRYYEDLKSVLDNLEKKSQQEYVDRLNSLPEEEKERLTGIYPNNGKKLYLEVTVENSLYAAALFDWLYGKSPTDNRSPKFLLGCQLHSIHFNVPGLSDSAKQAINQLKQELDKLEGI